MDALTALAAVVSAVVAIAAAAFSYRNAKGAMLSAEVADRGFRRANVLGLFHGFDAAGQATLQNPRLLYDVYGLDRSVPIEEAQNIAHLSHMLDAFQSFYGDAHDGDFSRMAEEMKRQTTFLNKILSVPANEARWEAAKSLYYGEFDASFVRAVDDIIAFERERRPLPQTPVA
ncbi:hypothetical protein Ade02nite_17060 [Paractinoplanes deccanensis]|uniref:Uncharacterized protein n=1 Tax=Paractinoplanes deccanensis TaxID=113561 RepID=A0ABQ3XZM5_9ACTN|nr:hypothetical protein [Actinoplanes deccanensis]GID73065.1 hypothetical protein Ade02nite_17060 [Actinoplanes deccanensis]